MRDAADRQREITDRMRNGPPNMSLPEQAIRDLEKIDEAIHERIMIDVMVPGTYTIGDGYRVGDPHPSDGPGSVSLIGDEPGGVPDWLVALRYMRPGEC